MDDNGPIPPDLQPQPEEDTRTRKGGLVRLTFYGDNAPTLEDLESAVEEALRAKGFDVKASRSEWT